jgi:AhpD family alkylhydroperoxidase
MWERIAVNRQEEEDKVNRQQVYKEIEETMGVVPSFLKALPDSSLELEWRTMKQTQMEPGPIPNKYRELIGLAVAAATRCRYCTFFHTEMAKLNGASEAEVEDAVHFAKSTMGWSTYLNGMQMDYEQFKAEVQKAVAHARKVGAGRK